MKKKFNIFKSKMNTLNTKTQAEASSSNVDNKNTKKLSLTFLFNYIKELEDKINILDSNHKELNTKIEDLYGV